MLVAEPPRCDRAERQFVRTSSNAFFEKRRLRAPLLFFCVISKHPLRA